MYGSGLLCKNRTGLIYLQNEKCHQILLQETSRLDCCYTKEAAGLISLDPGFGGAGLLFWVIIAKSALAAKHHLDSVAYTFKSGF